MTLDEAIKLLQQDIDDPGSVPIEELNQAEQIAIEAFQRVNFRREQLSWKFEPLLPSESPPDTPPYFFVSPENAKS